MIYFIGLVLMKVCVFGIFQLLPWIAWVGDWALRWTEGSEALQIAFVMFVFPLVMNALQYYVVDSFIKDGKGEREGFERVASEEEEDDDDDDSVDEEVGRGRREGEGYDEVRGSGEEGVKKGKDAGVRTKEVVKAEEGRGASSSGSSSSR